MLGAARFMGTLVALVEAGAIVAQLEGAPPLREPDDHEE
jgi:hypothetical protein